MSRIRTTAQARKLRPTAMTICKHRNEGTRLPRPVSLAGLTLWMKRIDNPRIRKMDREQRASIGRVAELIAVMKKHEARK